MTSAPKSWRDIARKKPAVFNIAPHLPFVDTLARGILDDADDNPLALTSITVLLPTRRACRSLREAFLRLSDGKPLLLPRLIPLNDLDEDEVLFSSFGTTEATENIPPPISPLKRQLLLARLIQARGDVRAEQAIRLAEELAKFLDQVQTEQLSLEKLTDLVPEDYAEHWQLTLKFLGILTETWPNILNAEGAMDPAEHRNRVFAAQTRIWAEKGAAGPVIVAGSTGSIPATATLLATVANMKNGAVVLPGLDQDLSESDWSEVDESHPQYGFKQLLARFEVSPGMVQPWPLHGKDPKNTRSERENDVVKAHFLTEVMRPAATTHIWRSMAPMDSSAVAGLTQINCPAPREEAEAISLIMRQALTEDERTCALVTPDRALAERVSMELKRWHIDIDDSAGRPLHKTPPGAFLRLVAAMGAEDFAPVPTLAMCKHPLAGGGMDTAEFRKLTRRAEVILLRGPRPPAGLAGLKQLAKEIPDDASDIDLWINQLKKCCGKFIAVMDKESASISEILNAHMAAAEALATTHDVPGPLRLWAEDAGEAASAFIAELAQCCDVLPPISPLEYPALLETLMSVRVVRPRYGKHPRLHILGPLEARLQHFDVLILAGLNEGTWPAEAAADPWMSRPMRKKFGLPSPERRIGLAAHDIAQALCGPRVVMTRSEKVDGTPTVPSRWLMRLDRAVAAAGLAKAFRDEAGDWLPWARELTEPRSYESIAPPAPKPPVKARPRRLSVTEIEMWMRDPYSIYARHVLKLRPLDPLDQDVNAADYGSLVHDALHRFIEAHPTGPLPKNALTKLLKTGETVFAKGALRPGVLAFWAPRFERIAEWFIQTESARRTELSQSFVEIKGEVNLRGPGGSFKLVGKADRIDRTKDGRITIIDYKTGSPPSDEEVVAGFSPQLPLEAAMVSAGGFEGVPKGKLDALSFWHLHGRGDGGRESIIDEDVDALAAEARKGLAALITKFDDPNTAYEARPNPAYAPTFSDYGHLARVKEWAAGEDNT
jgi:ATP-dependent helicase/nuclease subunit B